MKDSYSHADLSNEKVKDKLRAHLKDGNAIRILFESDLNGEDSTEFHAETVADDVHFLGVGAAGILSIPDDGNIQYKTVPGQDADMEIVDIKEIEMVSQ